MVGSRWVSCGSCRFGTFRTKLDFGYGMVLKELGGFGREALSLGVEVVAVPVEQVGVSGLAEDTLWLHGGANNFIVILNS